MTAAGLSLQDGSRMGVRRSVDGEQVESLFSGGGRALKGEDGMRMRVT